MIDKLWYWDSFNAIVLYARWREEIYYDYPTHGKYEEWVFELNYTDEVDRILPNIKSSIQFISEYYFDGIITEAYIQISPVNWDDDIEINIHSNQMEEIKSKKYGGFWESEIIDTKLYNTKDYSFYSHVRIDEDKLNERLKSILNLWKDRQYSFYPYKNTIRIDRQIEIVVNYLIQKLDKYEPDHLYISLAEIYNIFPESRMDDDMEEYLVYKYFDEEHFDACSCLYLLDKIWAIYIQSGFFWFGDDESIFFTISVLDKFYDLFAWGNIESWINQIIKDEGIVLRWSKSLKPMKLDKYIKNEGISYDDPSWILFINWKPKRLLQKQKIFVEAIFDLSEKWKDGWVLLEEIAIYDDHSFEDIDEKTKEKIIKNFYNIGNHLNKTIQLESGIEKVLEINLKSVRLNPKYIS